MRWGEQIEVRPLAGTETAREAGYLAKYATKATEVVGGLMHRLDTEDVKRLRVRAHLCRDVECAWRLGGCEHLRGLRLRKWSHALGFRGHCFTKSRRYSTTFTALRKARHEHVLRRLRGDEEHDAGGRCELRYWRYSGSGYRTLGDAWLAESGRQRALEQRRVAREELRAGDAASGGSRHEGRR